MTLQREQNGGRIVSCFAWRMLLGVVGVVMLGATVTTAQEQEVIDAGKREFQRSCASCHGAEARGNGPAANVLSVKPADLTQIKKTHGGTFLFWRTYDTISGRGEEVTIRGHGTREMPVWGDRFRLEPGVNEQQALGVRGRLLSLVHYLQSIQEP
jgi:mono/diheme cytochrome c family protein